MLPHMYARLAFMALLSSFVSAAPVCTTKTATWGVTMTTTTTMTDSTSSTSSSSTTTSSTGSMTALTTSSSPSSLTAPSSTSSSSQVAWPSAVPSSSEPSSASTSVTSNTATTTTASPPTTRATYNSSSAFNYTSETIRGVNLGGWLVLESWITPSLFDDTDNDKIVDEFTFTQLQDKDKAKAALKKHWDTFITEDDFKQIAEAGLNHVRIPIGYWAYNLKENETYIDGQDAYLEKAIGWAKKHDIKVLIDVHGLPGSQNGFDNSGQRGDLRWPDDEENMRRSVDVIAKISTKYSAPEYAETVTAVGVINEPAGFRGDKVVKAVKQFYKESYPKVRTPYEGRNDESGFLFVMADAFVGMDKHWKDFVPADKHIGSAFDIHYYQIFDDRQNAWDLDTHLKNACGYKSKLRSSVLPAMTGEWSVAATDCAKYLNGRGIGSRYDGSYGGESEHIGDCSAMTGSGDNFTDEYKEFLGKFWDVQTQTSEQYGIGWFFWTWKNEEAAEWSYKRGMELGFILNKADQHEFKLEDVCK